MPPSSCWQVHGYHGASAPVAIADTGWPAEDLDHIRMSYLVRKQVRALKR